MDWLKNNIRKLDAEALLFYACVAAFFCMPLGNAPMTVFGVGAFAIWLFSGIAFRTFGQYLRHSWFWPVLLLIVLPWLGLLYTPDISGLSLKYAKKTHYWLYGLAVAGIAFQRYPAETLIRAFLAGLLANSVTAVVQILYLVATGQTLPYDLGVGHGYSSMSAYLVLGILTASFYFKHRQGQRQRWLIGALMALYFFHLIMMQGRNGYFTFVVLSPLLVCNLIDRLNLKKIIAVYTLLAAAALASPAVRFKIDYTIKQVQSHLDASPEKAWGRDYIAKEERFWIYANAIQVFRDHPLIGVGTGGFQTVVQNRGKPDWPLLKHPHSSILQMAVSYGLIGVLALLWMFWEMIKNSWSQRHRVSGYFVWSAALVLFVSGVWNSQVLNAGTAFLFGVSAGLQEGLPRYQPSGHRRSNTLDTRSPPPENTSAKPKVPL
jgi:O-antigen ligase